MAKFKFTKGELKRQRDALGQFERYLPTLQLKKQQLQMEILRQRTILEEKRQQQAAKKQAVLAWAGLLSEPIALSPWLKPQKILSAVKNIAGIDIAVFQDVEFAPAEYDLFVTPLWVDAALVALRELILLREEITLLETGIEILRAQLRITAQRVNLFEKVKIPQAQEAIRRIKIYIGDQATNAVGRSKMAKRKIEALVLSGVAG
ncbi:MAG: V-type ATP synthase subunit D [Candidatus Omnitrophica bacterium]|nr:V-type ATP synthase subunit D [Candidatus Omnitrophota bacterium]